MASDNDGNIITIKAYGNKVLLDMSLDVLRGTALSARQGTIVSLGHLALGDGDPLQVGDVVVITDGVKLQKVRSNGTTYGMVLRNHIDYVVSSSPPIEA